MESLDFDYLRRFQTRWYRVERVLLVIMLLIAVAALTGRLGDDRAQGVTIAAPDRSVRLTYNAVARFSSSSKIRIEVIAPSGSEDFPVAFSKAFLGHAMIDSVSPVPAFMSTDNGGVVYHFIPARMSGGSIEFTIRNESVGHDKTDLTIDGRPYAFARWVLP